MKSAVPPTAKIAKDAKECVQECVSEFISFITSEAAEKCQLEKRKTIGGEDILYAMGTLGFDNYAETLKIHLAKLRQVCSLVLRFLVISSEVSVPEWSSGVNGNRFYPCRTKGMIVKLSRVTSDACSIFHANTKM